MYSSFTNLNIVASFALYLEVWLHQVNAVKKHIVDLDLSMRSKDKDAPRSMDGLASQRRLHPRQYRGVDCRNDEVFNDRNSSILQVIYRAIGILRL
jgi:hypothetical protein